MTNFCFVFFKRGKLKGFCLLYYLLFSRLPASPFFLFFKPNILYLRVGSFVLMSRHMKQQKKQSLPRSSLVVITILFFFVFDILFSSFFFQSNYTHTHTWFLLYIVSEFFQIRPPIRRKMTKKTTHFSTNSSIFFFFFLVNGGKCIANEYWKSSIEDTIFTRQRGTG